MDTPKRDHLNLMMANPILRTENKTRSGSYSIGPPKSTSLSNSNRPPKKAVDITRILVPITHGSPKLTLMSAADYAE